MTLQKCSMKSVICGEGTADEGHGLINELPPPNVFVFSIVRFVQGGSSKRLVPVLLGDDIIGKRSLRLKLPNRFIYDDDEVDDDYY